MVETSTKGTDNIFKIFRLSDGAIGNVHIYDTAGQEVYRAVSLNYYRKADCCLLVYDITNYNSFKDCVDYYQKNIDEKCKKGIKVVLLGNKTDLEKDRKVQPEEGASFANKNNYIFNEASCLKNTNVSDAFETLIELTNLELKKNNKDENINNNGNDTVKLESGNQNEEKSKGCGLC